MPTPTEPRWNESQWEAAWEWHSGHSVQWTPRDGIHITLKGHLPDDGQWPRRKWFRWELSTGATCFFPFAMTCIGTADTLTEAQAKAMAQVDEVEAVRTQYVGRKEAP
jgi:hypothetical protein